MVLTMASRPSKVRQQYHQSSNNNVINTNGLAVAGVVAVPVGTGMTTNHSTTYPTDINTTRRKKKGFAKLYDKYCYRRKCSMLLIVIFGIGLNLIFACMVGFLFHMFSDSGQSQPLQHSRVHSPPPPPPPPLQPPQKDYYLRATLPPRNSSTDTIGFVHVGKTGGSTITTMIRNGCNSFAADGPCHANITHESQISKLVEHYYHVPDFWRLPTSNHQKFLVSVRDVYDRTVSALLYQHPDNAKAYDLRLSRNQQHYGPIAYGCFPTLESFATLLSKYHDTNSSRTTINTAEDCNYPYRFNQVIATDCNALACAAIHGKVRFFSHLYFNYRNIIETKLPFINFSSYDSFHSRQSTTDTTEERQIYVIRQERFWDDWIQVNKLLGQTTPVFVPTSELSSSSFTSAGIKIQRNVSGIDVPVKRTISQQGRYYICQALEAEYIAYFKLLRKAVNIYVDREQMKICVDIAEKNCPNLNIRQMAYS